MTKQNAPAPAPEPAPENAERGGWPAQPADDHDETPAAPAEQEG